MRVLKNDGNYHVVSYKQNGKIVYGNLRDGKIQPVGSPPTDWTISRYMENNNWLRVVGISNRKEIYGCPLDYVLRWDYSLFNSRRK